VGSGERPVPTLVIGDDLGHMTGHDRQVGLDPVEPARVAFDPSHELAARTMAGDVQRRREPQARVGVLLEGGHGGDGRRCASGRFTAGRS
jgi:hypothetical protein